VPLIGRVSEQLEKAGHTSERLVAFLLHLGKQLIFFHNSGLSLMFSNIGDLFFLKSHYSTDLANLFHYNVIFNANWKYFSSIM